MKITKVLTYRHKETKEVRNFVWFKTTHIGDPPVEAQLQMDEVPASEIEISGQKTPLEARVRITLPTDLRASDLSLHDAFLNGDFKDGKWEPVRAKPEIPDIPLPDPSEVLPTKVNRSLLDSAEGRFRPKRP